MPIPTFRFSIHLWLIPYCMYWESMVVLSLWWRNLHRHFFSQMAMTKYTTHLGTWKDLQPFRKKIWPCTLPIGATVSLEMFSRRVVSSDFILLPKSLTVCLWWYPIVWWSATLCFQQMRMVSPSVNPWRYSRNMPTGWVLCRDPEFFGCLQTLDASYQMITWWGLRCP
jgi:hypothetical protein